MGETWWDEGDQLAIDLIARRDVEGSFRQTWPDRPIIKLLFVIFQNQPKSLQIMQRHIDGNLEPTWESSMRSMLDPDQDCISLDWDGRWHLGKELDLL